MKKKVLCSLAALGLAAVSLASCGVSSNEELLELNYRRVFLDNSSNIDGGGNNGLVRGKIDVMTAFTPEFIQAGGKVSFDAVLSGTTTSAEEYLDFSGINAGTAKSVTVVSPFAGTGEQVIDVIATVQLGDMTKTIKWVLTLPEQKIESASLSAVLAKFYARVGDPTNNTPATSAVKTDANGDPIYGFMFKTNMGVARSFIANNVAAGTEEFVQSKALGVGFNITANTQANFLTSANADELEALITQMFNGDNLGASISSGDERKSVLEVAIELCSENKAFGVELSQADKKALENTGIKAALDNIALVVKTANYTGTNELCAKLVAYANTL